MMEAGIRFYWLISNEAGLNLYLRLDFELMKNFEGGSICSGWLMAVPEADKIKI